MKLSPAFAFVTVRSREEMGVAPDLIMLGKIIGGGMPIGAVAGRADLMDLLAPVGPVYQAGTLSGNPISVRAGLETLKILAQPGVYSSSKNPASSLAKGLLDALRSSGEKGCVNRVGSLVTMFLGRDSVTDADEARRSDTAKFATYFHRMLERGIYLPPSQFEAMFVSLAHSDADIDATVNAARESLRDLRCGLRGCSDARRTIEKSAVAAMRGCILPAAMQFTTSPIAGGRSAIWPTNISAHRTAPIFALLGFVLGFIGGTINLVRILKVPSNRNDFADADHPVDPDDQSRAGVIERRPARVFCFRHGGRHRMSRRRRGRGRESVSARRARPLRLVCGATERRRQQARPCRVAAQSRADGGVDIRRLCASPYRWFGLCAGRLDSGDGDNY